jgi:predicted transcriptional regulator
MDHIKMVFSIDILDYYQADIRYSSKWLIKTKYSKEQLGGIVKKMVNKKIEFTNSSLKELADEMEKMGYFKIIEDLTGVVQHTIECEMQ